MLVAMKLRAGRHGKAGADRKAFRRGKPCGMVLEGGVLTRTLGVDLLNRSLLTDFLPAQALRGVGLHLLANVGPLRRLVMQGGMGAPGNLPRLMQPGGLSRLSP